MSLSLNCCHPPGASQCHCDCRCLRTRPVFQRLHYFRTVSGYLTTPPWALSSVRHATPVPRRHARVCALSLALPPALAPSESRTGHVGQRQVTDH